MERMRSPRVFGAGKLAVLLPLFANVTERVACSFLLLGFVFIVFINFSGYFRQVVFRSS